MAIIVLIQMTLVTLIMAQAPFSENNYLDGWWFHVTPARNPFTSPSTTSCLLPSQPVARRDDYTYTPRIGGHKLHTRAVPWNEARITCEEEGGYLLIINSIAEANTTVELFRNSEPISGSPHPDFVHIGFHDLYNEGQFITIHGQSLAKAGFTQWLSGQPDNSGGAENCGSFYKSGRLNDINCGIKLGFICEVPIY